MKMLLLLRLASSDGDVIAALEKLASTAVADDRGQQEDTLGCDQTDRLKTELAQIR